MGIQYLDLVEVKKGFYKGCCGVAKKTHSLCISSTSSMDVVEVSLESRPHKDDDRILNPPVIVNFDVDMLEVIAPGSED